MPQLRGMIPPLPTPFSASGELDVPALQSLIEGLEPFVDGFLILGSNGEAVFLSEDERRTVLEAAREVIPKDKPMIAGTGGEATRLVERRNEVAAEVGADYALVLAPHYYKGGMNEAVLKTHFECLADSSHLPLMLYNIPAATTLSLSPMLIAKLAEHENIIGLKDSSGQCRQPHRNHAARSRRLHRFDRQRAHPLSGAFTRRERGHFGSSKRSGGGVWEDDDSL